VENEENLIEYISISFRSICLHTPAHTPACLLLFIAEKHSKQRILIACESDDDNDDDEEDEKQVVKRINCAISISSLHFHANINLITFNLSFDISLSTHFISDPLARTHLGEEKTVN
jgi:hypothetical protein